jgi:hypothetical protein
MSIRVEAIRTIPHGIVFVYDPTTPIDVPHDTGVAPVLATTNCVSIWAQHEDDGVTELVMSTSFEDSDCSLIFQGTVASVGGKLAINMSDCETAVEIDGLDVTTALKIYANGTPFPSKIVCVVGGQHG